MSADRRQAATEAHLRALSTINEMFDRLDELTAARDRLTGVAARQPDDDPVQDAEGLLAGAARLGGALDALRSAALAAAEHRPRGELATDIGTKTAALFPRAARQSVPTRVAGDTERRVVRIAAVPVDQVPPDTVTGPAAS